MEVMNRVTVSPMAMYSAVDGTPNDFHFVHYGERAIGGAGLLFTEMTCVSPEGRISPGCTGMWNADHVAAWKRIVDFVHTQSKAKICLQLGHSGGKGSTKLGWEGNDVPLDDGNWPVMAASDVAWSPVNQVPRPMTRADMDAVRDQFVAAVCMGIQAGFDMVELHAAHGRIWRAAREPPPLPARSLRRDARGVAQRPADVGPNFGDRLGRRKRDHAG
jgi:anthraniloyl-CoA monooxygenase